MKQNESTFRNLIFNGGWLDHPCGTGSLLKNTSNLREQLPKVVKELGVKTLLDAPCGDYSWMNNVVWDSTVNYIGADIVSELIDQNKQKYPNIKFQHLDIINDSLPDADLLMCRDCLIHFSWADVKKFFYNFIDSNVTYIGITNYVPGDNFDIMTGGCHHIDLTSSPAKLSSPLIIVNDKENTNRPCHFSIWDKSQIKTALSNWN